MSREELEKQLSASKFRFWRDEEYHRDAYTNENALIKTENGLKIRASLEIFIDYYTVRIVWYLENGRKVAKSYYVHKLPNNFDSLDSLLSDFANECFTLYKVDLDKYAV